jgi:hypothetical protein
MKSKPPNAPKSFRRSHVVSPVPSERRSKGVKIEKKRFYIWVSDIETGQDTLAITVFAVTQREAIQIGKKRLQSSPVLRRIRHAAFSAVEVKS